MAGALGSMKAEICQRPWGALALKARLQAALPADSALPATVVRPTSMPSGRLATRVKGALTEAPTRSRNIATACTVSPGR